MKKEIIDIIADYSVNEGMNDILFENEEYIKIEDEMNKQIRRFDSLNLTKEQNLVVDRLICSHIECGAFYGRMAYRKGFQDCVALLQEIGMFKNAS